LNPPARITQQKQIAKEGYMFTRHRSRRRRGATVVEFAIIAPVVLVCIFAQIVGGMGIFRYLEVAHLAREGARYSSTHGGMYRQEGIETQTGIPAITSSSDLRSYLAGKTVLLDPSQLEVSVSWSAPGNYNPANMPTYTDTNPNLIPPGQIVISNNVIVTVKYQWLPEYFKIGPITLTSTSNMPMSY
jgi:Flp pilus assembly protein TadG